jgi:hypothetical protein
MLEQDKVNTVKIQTGYDKFLATTTGYERPSFQSLVATGGSGRSGIAETEVLERLGSLTLRSGITREKCQKCRQVVGSEGSV